MLVARRNSSLWSWWQNFLQSLLVHSSPEGVSPGLLVFFRVFLTVKILSPELFPQGWLATPAVASLGVLSVMLLLTVSRWYRLALALVAGVSGYEAYSSWPFTINHGGLEFIALMLLLLEPPPSSETQVLRAGTLIKLLMISVWFYSGMHKICDGYYLHGEFFALEALGQDTGMGKKLAALWQFAAGLLHENTSLPLLACCSARQLGVSVAGAAFFIGLSWATILAELLLPLALFFHRTRYLALAALFVFQGMIAYFSGEIDFAFTAYAILLLFVPVLYRWTYPVLIAAYLWVCPWG